MIKCSQCGGTEFDKGSMYSSFRIEYKSVDRRFINVRTNAYLCLNCGHLELFAANKKYVKEMKKQKGK
jgi:predicted nucleic-acid-binding Zn-ribbon protein